MARKTKSKCYQAVKDFPNDSLLVRGPHPSRDIKSRYVWCIVCKRALEHLDDNEGMYSKDKIQDHVAGSKHVAAMAKMEMKIIDACQQDKSADKSTAESPAEEDTSDESIEEKFNRETKNTFVLCGIPLYTLREPATIAFMEKWTGHKLDLSDIKPREPADNWFSEGHL